MTTTTTTTTTAPVCHSVPAEDVVRAVQATGSHFFDSPTARAGWMIPTGGWGSAIWIIVTSERAPGESRRYSVRRFDVKNGVDMLSIDSIGAGFGGYRSARAARTEAARQAHSLAVQVAEGWGFGSL